MGGSYPVLFKWFLIDVIVVLVPGVLMISSRGPFLMLATCPGSDVLFYCCFTFVKGVVFATAFISLIILSFLT